MPELKHGHYLIELLHDAGTIAYNEGVARRLSWVELKSWADFVGYELDSWEASTIMQLSACYAETSNEGQQIDCPMPCQPTMTEDRRKSVSMNIKNALRSIAKVR